MVSIEVGEISRVEMVYSDDSSVVVDALEFMDKGLADDAGIEVKDGFVIRERSHATADGKWNAPPGLNLPVDYDKIADIYDSLFESTEFKDEELRVAKILSKWIDGLNVLDIGSGSGLLLKLVSIPPDLYCGVDPSLKMTGILKESFPNHEVRVNHVCVEDLNKADMFVSLFGSASYTDPSVIKKIIESNSKYFLMFYRDGYTPVTYRKTGITFMRNSVLDYRIDKSLCDSTTFENYVLVSNLG